MPNYVCIMHQKGQGCDYTIGCGTKVKTLEAPNLTEARSAVIKLLYMDEYFDGSANPDYYLDGEQALKSWILYEVSGKYDFMPELLALKDKAENQKKLEERKKDEGELARLKKKLDHA